MKTGISGLDEILEGGLIRERTYLLVGSPGTGKTIFSLQWLLDGVRAKEKCLYITLAERFEEISRNVQVFEWDLANIVFLDLTPGKCITSEDLQEYQVFSPSEVEQFAVWDEIFKTISEVKPDRLIIDSTTQLRYLSLDEYQFRKHILTLVSYLNSTGITSLLLFEPTELERETSVALAVNGIIRLNLEISQSRAIGIRTVQIEKMRGSSFMSGLHPFQISNTGIQIYPHIIEKIGFCALGKALIPFGIKSLDKLLKGGIDSGTTTIISGPSGVGKSTLGTQFLVNGAKNGAKGLLITFEEPVESILIRGRKINISVDKFLENGSLKVIRVNPMEVYPDQLLSFVRQMVEHEHFSIVMIDSLRGYHIAMEEYGTLNAHLCNLINYLNRNEATTLLINEVEAITGNLRITDVGVSHLADNVILMRYAELNSQVVKLVCCLKKRLSDFESQLRTINYSSKGIEVGDVLTEMQGILTGTPYFKLNS
ncbi:ATPase domain-containing protein [Legionella longbeachae]|uniref:ATPase domain-containing protein n=1 Tax=Legionella longbeachae TaxID=450 RepID=UPI0013EEB6C4|nr:ATPase domain-containing protein [Legionella longbeachae]UAK47098.1 hypothetical protein K8O86_02585 [Legionella longbeachae]